MKGTIVHEGPGSLHIKTRYRRHLSIGEADQLQYALLAVDGVQDVKVFDRSGSVLIRYTGEREAVICGYAAFSFERVPAGLVPAHTGRELERKYWEKMVNKLAGRVLRRFLLPGIVRRFITLVRAVPYVGKGLKALWQRRLDVGVLDAVSISAALWMGDYSTASAVIFLLDIGGILEEWTYKKSVDDLARSMSLNVSRVWRLKDGREEWTPIGQIAAGDRVRVDMGSTIPLDGTVAEGEAMVNQAALTGEAVPVRKGEGATVFAGTVVTEGSLVIRVREVLGNTKYDQIIHMIESSQKMKSSLQEKADHLADKLVPYTLAAFPLTWALTGSLTKAMSVLMVDFSCALKLSTPIAVLSAMREARSYQLTVKGGRFMENFARADTIVFDKTGTITRAMPSVAAVIPFEDYEADEMLRMAACLEEHFPHSMANAVVQRAEEKQLLHEEMHAKVHYIVAHGIASEVNGQPVVIGSWHFVFEDEGVAIRDGDREKVEGLAPEYSYLYLGIGGRLAAAIAIADPIRAGVPALIQGLRSHGFRQVVMMTGDSEKTARAIAAAAGIDAYHSEVLPEHKADFIMEEKAKGRIVVMVGDGINDSPALSEADVGVAIREGADIACEVADITLSQNNLESLITLKEISDGLLRRTRSNYHFIVGWNSAVVIGGVLGIFAPGTAALLHNLSTIYIGVHSMENLLEK